jgi:hypothetical protein
LSDQWTEKAYEALLEGPFADSILTTAIFQTRRRKSAGEGGGGMILGKLEDRLAENRRKFPWKTLFSSFDIQDLK